MSGTDLSGNIHQGCPDEERRAAVYQMQITPQPFVHSMVSISFLWVKKTTRGGQPVEWELRKKASESEGHRWGGIRSALMHRDVPSLLFPTWGTFVQWDFHSAFLSPGELQWLMLSSLWGCCGRRGQGWGLRQRHGETHREPSHSYPTLQGSWVVAAPYTWELKGTRAWGVQDWRAGTPGAARRRGMIPLPVCNKNSLQ